MVSFLFITGLSLLFAGMGLWTWKKPRRRINPLVGYRTARSMKSQAAWDFAQAYSGKVMCFTGCAMLAAALLLFLIAPGIFDDGPAAAILSLMIIPTVAASVLPLYLTERKLKRLFDEAGNPIK